MKETCTKFRMFTVPEYEKEEAWLREQHNKGWKFIGVTFPGFYKFLQCEPCDVIYQLDYNKEGSADKATYTQMFSDCGWTYITEFVGYSYFSKSVLDMTSDHEGIFSDEASKLEMCKRVFVGRMLPLLAIFIGVIIPQMFLQFSIGFRPLVYLYIALFTVYVVLFSWFGIQYYKLKQRLAK